MCTNSWQGLDTRQPVKGMDVRITRVREGIDLPNYMTNGATAFDFVSAIDVTIPPKTMVYVPTGLIIATPPGYALVIAPRSSLFRKKNLMMANGMGIIDQDFCGPEDEIQLPLWNPTETAVTITKNERLTQGMFVKIERAAWNESSPEGSSRGGLGSTDGYNKSLQT